MIPSPLDLCNDEPLGCFFLWNTLKTETNPSPTTREWREIIRYFFEEQGHWRRLALSMERHITEPQKLAVSKFVKTRRSQLDTIEYDISTTRITESGNERWVIHTLTLADKEVLTLAIRERHLVTHGGDLIDGTRLLSQTPVGFSIPNHATTATLHFQDGSSRSLTLSERILTHPSGQSHKNADIRITPEDYVTPGDYELNKTLSHTLATDSQVTDAGYSLRVDGPIAHITTPLGTFTCTYDAGMQYLRWFVSNPRKKSNPCYIFNAVNGLPQSKAQSDECARTTEVVKDGIGVNDRTDNKMTAELRQRLGAIALERARAVKSEDTEKCRLLDKEVTDIEKTLHADIGLGGRIRRFSHAETRAIQAIRRAISRTYSDIKKDSGNKKSRVTFVNEMRQGISFGGECCYTPNPTVEWKIRV